MESTESNQNPLEYKDKYLKVNRAELRLSRNLQSSLWTFVTYTGFHFLFIYAIFSKEAASMQVPNWLAGIAIIIGGICLHVVSLMSMNKYRGHLQANEKVIRELEKEVEDYQQKAEEEWPQKRLSGAGKARKFFFWMLLALEVFIAITYFYK